MHVAEFRVPVAEIADLFGADAIEAFVALAEIALPVLPFAVYNA